MQFEAMRNGKVVRASYEDLTKAGAEEGERVLGIGSTPYEVIYRNEEKGEQRTVDLRDAATASGMEKVEFRFDRDKAIEMGLMSKEANVKQADVYNLERIKTESGRMKYLADQGYQGILREGDAYYATKDGSVVPINKTVGLGVDDITRMAADGGRDIGSGVAATAAYGAGIVTGGVALAGVGAAGAAGGVAGEGAQRALDKLVGADADKYNAEMTGAEEATAFGKAGAVGAANAYGGQAISRIGGALKGAASSALGKAASFAESKGMTPAKEWAEGQAAKLDMSALQQRLPSGVFGRSKSSEEAAAQTLMEQGSKAGVSSGTRREAADTSKKLMDGSLRGAAVRSEEEAAQQVVMRQQAEVLGEKAAKETQDEALSKMAKKSGMDVEVVRAKEEMKAKSQEIFSRHSKDLDEVFTEGGSQAASDAAKTRIEKEVFGAFSKETGVEFTTDAATGRVSGVNNDSVRNYVTKQIDDTFSVASDYIKAQKKDFAPGDVVPNPGVKQEVISTTQKLTSGLQGKEFGPIKKEISAFNAAVRGHSEDPTSQMRLRDTIDALEESIRSNYGAKGVKEETTDALRRLEEATSRYQINATKNVEGLQQALNIQTEYMAMKKMVSDGVMDSSSRSTVKFMEGMQTLEKLTGESRATGMRNVVGALDLEATALGRSSQFRTLLEPAERARGDALQYILRNDIPKQAGESAKEGMLSKAVNKGGAEELMELGASIIPGGRAVLAAARLASMGTGANGGAAAAKVKAIAQGAKQAGARAANGALSVARNSNVQFAGTREVAGSEEAMSYKPQAKKEQQGRLAAR